MAYVYKYKDGKLTEDPEMEKACSAVDEDIPRALEKLNYEEFASVGDKGRAALTIYELETGSGLDYRPFLVEYDIGERYFLVLFNALHEVLKFSIEQIPLINRMLDDYNKEEREK